MQQEFETNHQFDPRNSTAVNRGQKETKLFSRLGDSICVLSVDALQGPPAQRTFMLGRNREVGSTSYPATGGLRAELRVKTGGARFVFRCDWNDGSIITLPASACEVWAVPFVFGGETWTPFTDEVSVQAADLPASEASSPTFTDWLASVTNANAVSVVPPFARAFTVLGVSGLSPYPLRVEIQHAGSPLHVDSAYTGGRVLLPGLSGLTVRVKKVDDTAVKPCVVYELAG